MQSASAHMIRWHYSDILAPWTKLEYRLMTFRHLNLPYALLFA